MNMEGIKSILTLAKSRSQLTLSLPLMAESRPELELDLAKRLRRDTADLEEWVSLGNVLLVQLGRFSVEA